MRHTSSRRAFFAVALLAVAACSSGGKLHTMKAPTGAGHAEVEVENQSGVAISHLYLARSEKVRAAGRDALRGGEEVWGADLLERSALREGERFPVVITEPGTFDLKAQDPEGYVQHIGDVKIGAGGRYRVVLGDGDWRSAP